MLGVRPSVRLPKPDGAQLRQRADGLAKSALDRLHPRHEGGADRADARNQDSQLPIGGRNRGVFFGGQLRISLGAARMLVKRYPR